MRRSAILVLACLAALAALSRPAFAASNGMLAAVVADGKVVTLNPDGSGLKTLWAPTAPVTGLAWSPDGNQLAMIVGDKLAVLDVAAGTAPKAFPPDGTRGADPTWSTSLDDPKIAFRRFGPLGQSRAFASPDLGTVVVRDPDLGAEAFAFAPNLTDFAFTAGGLLFWSGMTLELVSGAESTPAWSADGRSLAFVTSAPQFPETQAGLYT